MSYTGLIEQEKQAKAVYDKIRKSLNKELFGLKDEIKKIEMLLGDREALTKWASQPANSEQVSRILSSMSDVEQLYLNAGNSRAATIFKARVQKQLTSRLSNLKATELELKMRIARSKQQVTTQVVEGLSSIKRDAALREMYDQARMSGGFLGNFGRAYLNDLVTLETKAAGSKTLGEYMNNLYNTYEKGVKDAFIHGIVRGDSYEMMEQNLQEATGVTLGKARLLVRTEANAIFNESVREVITDNPLVKGYRFRAVLDSHTSNICQQHDGEYIAKEDVMPGVNYPPLHPNCRSTVTTVLYDEDEKQDTVQRYTKNKKHQWEKVPVGMTYAEFKDKFGFSNSKNPATYNAETRDIHDATLARVMVNQYKGYVKPSVSAVGRIDKMVKAYAQGDREMISAVMENTGMPSPVQGIMRQAQAEAGFDGLPLQLTEREFDKQVERNNLVKVYRKFGKQEDLDSFVSGDQPYLKVGADIHGTKVFTERPEDMNGVVEMALKTPDKKILRTISRQSIRDGISGDNRIDLVLAETPESKRSAVFSAMAIEYGYDAVQFQEENDLSVLNRTAVIVRQPAEILPEDVQVETVRYSETVRREDYIAGNDPSIVRPKQGPAYVPNVIASAVKLDHKLPSNISAEARQVYKSAIENEKPLTDSLLKVVDNFEGARLDGVEFCVKTGSSVESKINRNIAKVLTKEGRNITDVEAIKMMDDLNRYTVVLPMDNLAEGTLKTIDELEAKGFEVTEVDNKFLLEDTAYKAIHLQAKTPEGTLLEIQMHTEEDLAIKAEAHHIYELQRELKDKDSAEWLIYQRQMVDMYAKLPDPKNVRSIKTFRGGKK